MIKLLPNILSLFRIASVPFILLFLYAGETYYFYAFVLFLMAAISDWLDGLIARHWDGLTDFGSWIDPVADKCLVLGVLIALSVLTDSNFLMGCNVLLIMRNVVMSMIRERCRRSQMASAVKVSSLGKTKTIFEFIYISFSLFYLAYSYYAVEEVLMLLGLLAVGFSYLSLCLYIKNLSDSLTIRYSKG
ncbi:MAG TPA: CDP-diacylglycerol--glycerol-3-phosphate 3-phosphatidyltransferase [Gammaproteobacteria bacterium]|nr:CDP-diacylglycerol--glycerol-3-phosphate 3-phosphatidyltransferase [Gammaproteobacteria bacterium]